MASKKTRKITVEEQDEISSQMKLVAALQQQFWDAARNLEELTNRVVECDSDLIDWMGKGDVKEFFEACSTSYNEEPKKADERIVLEVSK